MKSRELQFSFYYHSVSEFSADVGEFPLGFH
jgi:hypothetical protein